MSFNEKGNLLGVVCVESVKKYAFFIELGTIHAMGKGVLLEEIQQTTEHIECMIGEG